MCIGKIIARHTTKRNMYSTFVIKYSSVRRARVTGVDALREETFLSPSFSALFSISIEPLKYAPSSMMICAVVKSPFTEPFFLISILHFPRTLPCTLPYHDHLASNDVGCQLYNPLESSYARL